MAPLGSGGMGEVWRAHDSRLGRDVAIKVLPPHMSADPATRERFEREARAISKLSHPNICTLYDIGHQDGIDFLVLECIEGETLDEVLSRGPMPLDQVLRTGAAIADALDRAHRQGIVHRDLKPGNVILTRSGAKVLDFGLAKYTRDREPELDGATQQKPLTAEGAIVGTIQYMAPEQLEGGEADTRSDIFALGTILYEMATGRRAFQGKSRASLIAAILDREPAPISSIQPMTPASLDQIVRRCLAKNPDDRVQNARDLHLSLQEIRDQSRSSRDTTAVRRQTRAPLFITVAALVVLIAGAAGWLALRRRAPAAPAEKTKSIAVLPFADLGVAPSEQYLRLAIPDEITTILSSSSDVAVRPFSVSRRLGSDVDPRDAAQKLNATEIISGHVLAEEGRLSVTLEAIDTAADKLLWHEDFEVRSADLLTMRRELTERVQNGLMPRLGLGRVQSAAAGGPQNSEAYSLYLRAAAASSDVAPNKDALKLLEQAVKLDPGYAPAWAALSARWYYDGSYGSGGAASIERSREAATRALQLDPNLVDAAVRLESINTESGQAAAAYRAAKDLVARRPDSAAAHFILSYAARYGGELEESARQCEMAWTLDRGNRGLRSCAITYQSLGNYDRAAQFAAIDAGTEWSRNTMAGILLREGKPAEALPLLFNDPGRQLIARYLEHAPQAELQQIVDRLRQQTSSNIDGEPMYYIASYAAYSGLPAAAFEYLHEAIRRGYCAVPALDNDPLFASIRSLPEYRAVHDEGVACHERFLAEREK